MRVTSKHAILIEGPDVFKEYFYKSLGSIRNKVLQKLVFLNALIVFSKYMLPELRQRVIDKGWQPTRNLRTALRVNTYC